LDRSEPKLVRGLGPWAATSLVVGTVIGTGIFLKTAPMAHEAHSALWVLIAWACAGLLSFTGALTYAELGAMYPDAGGEYVFLRQGFGAMSGYLFAWIRFWIATPGSIAAYALGTGAFLGDVFPNQKLVAIVLIIVFTFVNCLNVRAGGHIQTVLTVMKVAMISVLAVGTLLLVKGDWGRVVDPGAGFPGGTTFGAMLIAALWAYDGWNNLPMVAGEVRDPQKNVARALVLGELAILIIYALVNVGYFHALPFSEVSANGTTSIAQRAAETFLGGTAQTLLAAAMAISAVSAMNGSMLTGARVPYAVAVDGLAPRALAKLHPKTHVPVVAVLVQGGGAIIYALGGGFDDVTDTVVFASWLFYVMNGVGVLVLRRRAPDHPRPYRVPGYPVVPVIFVMAALALLAVSVWVKPVASGIGLGATVLGAVVYMLTSRR
jgi:APA family basic amino acid/polyamine antiporter